MDGSKISGFLRQTGCVWRKKRDWLLVVSAGREPLSIKEDCVFVETGIDGETESDG